MRNLCAAVLSLALAGALHAREPGTSALPFLKLDASARAAALGGAYAGVGDGAFAVFYNPAGAAFVERKEAAFTHNMWLEGMHQESLAYVHPVSARLSVHGGLNLMFSGAMQRLDNAGLSSGSDFSSREGSYFAGVSALLSRSVFAGVSLKAYTQTADNETASSFGGDAGLLYHTGDFRLGVSAADFGAKLKFGSDAFGLPFRWRAGAAKSLYEQYWLTADWVQAVDADPYPCAGAEAEFELTRAQALFLRAGWNGGGSKDAGGGLAYGAGLRTFDLRIDYALSPMGELGAAHRFSLTYAFGGIRDDIPARRGYPRTYRPAKRNDPVSKRKKQAEEDEKLRRSRFTW